MMPSFEASLIHSSTKLPHKKLETLGYHMLKTRRLYLTWPGIGTGSWQTDRQTDRRTDRIAITNTHYAVPAGTAVARKNVIDFIYLNVQSYSAAHSNVTPGQQTLNKA